MPAPTAAIRPGSRRESANKRFTVRDGFHLSDRNDETRDRIDEQLAHRDEITSAPTTLPNNNLADAASEPALIGNEEKASHPGVDTEIALIFDFLQRAPPQLQQKGPVKQVERELHASGPTDGDVPENHRSETAAGRNSEEIDAASFRVVSLPTSYPSAEARAALSRLGPSSDWLVYRHRKNATTERHAKLVEQMVSAVLNCKDEEVLQPSAVDTKTIPMPKVGNRAKSKVSHPCPPSITAVAHAVAVVKDECRRHVGHASPQENVVDQSRLRHILRQAVFATTVTAGTEHHDNKNQASKAPHPPTSKFSTQRSLLRERTAVPLKGERLLTRLEVLRAVPGVAETVLHEQRLRRKDMFKQHGKNLVRINRLQSPRIPPLDCAADNEPHTNTSREMKRQLVLKRKEEEDAKQEAAVMRTVNRWENKRLRHQEHIRQHYHQSQWILLVVLAHASGSWMKRFEAFKSRRDSLFRMAMIKKIQRCWRQKLVLRSQSTFGYASNLHFRLKFYRMPVVMNAIHLLQISMRKWLVRKHLADNRRAVDIIVTSWFEFQDVKFRRLILRFRKRVRDFQVMWRTWRAITDARVKLLLLVWARVEKKHKRRGGLSGTPQTEEDPRSMMSSTPTDTSPGRRLDTIHRPPRHGGFAFAPQLASPQKQSADAHSHPHPAQDDFHNPMTDFHASSASPLSSGRMQPGGTIPAHGTARKNPSAVNSPSGPFKSTSPRHMTSTPPPLFAHSNNNHHHHQNDRLPLSLKVSLLRQLLSEKRKEFRARKDQQRNEWQARRKQLRRVDFRYNVLDELAAYHRFQAENAVFLLLRSIAEADIVLLIQLAHERLTVSTMLNPLWNQDNFTMYTPAHEPVPVENSRRSMTPNAPAHPRGKHESFRRSTLKTAGV